MKPVSSEALFEPNVRWTDDCQGKEDYDGPLVDYSTRYWPRGGGFDLISSVGWHGNETRPHIKPSAHASVRLRYGKPSEDSSGDSLTLIEQEFEGETEEVVKAQVEAWVREQHRRIVALLQTEFPPVSEGSPPTP